MERVVDDALVDQASARRSRRHVHQSIRGADRSRSTLEQLPRATLRKKGGRGGEGGGGGGGGDEGEERAELQAGVCRRERGRGLGVGVVLLAPKRIKDRRKKQACCSICECVLCVMCVLVLEYSMCESMNTTCF